MVTLVILINVLISIVCFYIAWRIVKLRRQIAKIANKIIGAERRVYAALHNAPTKISKGQRGAQQIQERYQQLEAKLQRLQQVVMLLSLGVRVWQGRRRTSVQRGRG